MTLLTPDTSGRVSCFCWCRRCSSLCPSGRGGQTRVWMRAWHDTGSASGLADPRAAGERLSRHGMAWQGTADRPGQLHQPRLLVSLSVCLLPWDVDKGVQPLPRKPGCSTLPTPIPRPLTRLCPHLARPLKTAVNLAAIFRTLKPPRPGSKDKKSASSLGFQSFPPHFPCPSLSIIPFWFSFSLLCISFCQSGTWPKHLLLLFWIVT